MKHGEGDLAGVELRNGGAWSVDGMVAELGTRGNKGRGGGHREFNRCWRLTEQTEKRPTLKKKIMERALQRKELDDDGRNGLRTSRRRRWRREMTGRDRSGRDFAND